ncbi:MAG: HAD-IA family hydrolase [Lachnospiraceae bacterium]|nr:HAD-IA family hydrolase [Lachnospiraceae bacterium]
MARSEHQKLKLYYIMKILQETTSKGHGITVPELIDKLDAYDITAERKSIYRDLSLINELGSPITVERYHDGGNVRYYAVGSGLTLSDIKILADAVAASKFVTEARAKELIGKFESMVSEHERRQLNRTVYISKHATETDDDGYSNIDPIQTAIRENRQIEFLYLQWNAKKELVPRGEGVRRSISPWWLAYNNGNYYLGAYDGAHGGMRTFRVDKMRNVVVTDERREGAEAARNGRSDPMRYAKARFQMFDGEEERVHVLCPEKKIGMFIDMFGSDLSIWKAEDGKYDVSFSTVPSRFFLSWVMALGDDVRFLSPQSAVDEMDAMCMAALQSHARRPITTVVFDLGGVLLRLRTEEYMDELGLSEEARAFVRNEVVLKADWQKMDEGVMTQDEAVGRAVAKRPDLESEIRLFFADMTRFVEPFPETDALLDELHEMGLSVYALSNYPRELFALHEKNSLPFLRKMDGLVVSGFEKRFKPNTDFYELFLSRFGKSASECVFIDDREDNIRAAEAVGMHGISAADRLSGLAQLKAFLAAHPAVKK